jgi:hypothetical protein
VNGEVTVSPFVGLLMVADANAGTAITEHKTKVKKFFMNWPLKI